MSAGRRSPVAVAAVMALCTVLHASVAHAYIYHLPNRVLGEQHIENGKSMQLSALPLGEGPMFSQADAPFGNDAPYIELSGTATLLSGAGRESTTMLNVVRAAERVGIACRCVDTARAHVRARVGPRLVLHGHGAIATRVLVHWLTPCSVHVPPSRCAGVLQPVQRGACGVAAAWHRRGRHARQP